MNAAQSNAIVSFNESQAKLMINMIDVGCARGAWRGSELNLIGQLYEHISSHMQVKNPQNPAVVPDGKGKGKEPANEAKVVSFE